MKWTEWKSPKEDRPHIGQYIQLEFVCFWTGSRKSVYEGIYTETAIGSISRNLMRLVSGLGIEETSSAIGRAWRGLKPKNKEMAREREKEAAQ